MKEKADTAKIFFLAYNLIDVDKDRRVLNE